MENKKHNCEYSFCTGIKLAILDGKTYCEYHSDYEKSFDSYDDGMPIFTAEHKFYPGEPWCKRVWFRVRDFFKYLFVRPKFSAAALEPAEEVQISKTPLDNFGILPSRNKSKKITKEMMHPDYSGKIDEADLAFFELLKEQIAMQPSIGEAQVENDFTYEYLPEQPMRD